MSPDLLLWQWSLITQGVSGAMIAGFFLVFGRSMRTPAMQRWTLAWLAHLAALAVTSVDVFLIDDSTPLSFAIVCGAYLAAKAVFVMAMLDGLHLARHPDQAPRAQHLPALGVALVFVGGALGVHSFAMVSLLAQALVGVAFLAGTALALGGRAQPVRWLAIGLALRGTLGILEAVAYGAETAPPLVLIPSAAGLLAKLVAVSSFFDATTEWLLALGCVMAATTRARHELESTNVALRDVQAALRAIMDVDALTGLANRRALPAILREVQPGGAALVFIDLRDFKQVNDAHGHQAGDALLKQFADALRDSFRPQDGIVRYAGDEFLVVAQGLSREAMEARLAGLRSGLAASRSGAGGILFDAGHAELEAGSRPEDAIAAADAAMYAAKLAARQGVLLGTRS